MHPKKFYQVPKEPSFGQRTLPTNIGELEPQTWWFESPTIGEKIPQVWPSNSPRGQSYSPDKFRALPKLVAPFLGGLNFSTEPLWGLHSSKWLGSHQKMVKTKIEGLPMGFQLSYVPLPISSTLWGYARCKTSKKPSKIARTYAPMYRANFCTGV